jgi:broad specificity phosphatase PhoE
MTTFLLIRHAATDAIGRLIAGWTPGWHLNTAGRKQAEMLAARLAPLPVQAIYTSPLERAVETAEPLARRLRLDLQKIDDLGELRFGDWEGFAFAELQQSSVWKRFNQQGSLAVPPGGESMMECQARIIRRLECLRERHPNHLVAVFSHADPLRAAVASFLGAPLDSMLRFDLDPASVSVVQVDESNTRILCVNSSGDIRL